MICEKGELLMEQLTKFSERTGLKTAWIQGLGAALDMELGFYDVETRTYGWKKFSQPPYEITAIQGNMVINKDGSPRLHLHGTFSDEHFAAFGGHIKELTVGGTCELHIRPLHIALTRSLDDLSGLETICAMPPIEHA